MTANGWRLVALFAVVYGVMGASGLTGQAINSMMKDGLRLGPAEAALFQGLATAPTYFAPFYGFLSDARPLFGSRRKSYLVFGGLLCGISWFLLGSASSAGYLAAFAAFACSLLFLSLLTTVANALMVEEGRRLSMTGVFQSVQWTAANSVALVAAWASGRLVDRFGRETPFRIYGFVPLAVTFAALLLLRERKPEAVTPRAAFRQLLGALQQPSMRASLLGVFLWFFSPGLGLPAYYYQRDVLQLTISDIGVLAGLGQGTGLLGAGAFALASRRASLRLTLFTAVVSGSLAHLGFIWMRNLRSAQVLTALDGFVSMFAMLALFDLAAKRCPEGAEGSSFALVTAIRVFAIMGGGYLGGWLYDHFGFHVLILVSAAFTAACLLVIPRPREEMERGEPGFER